MIRSQDPHIQAPGRIEVPVFLEDALPDVFAAAPAPKRPGPEVSPAGLAHDPATLARALGGSAATLSQPNSSSSLTSLLVEGLEIRVSPTHPGLVACCCADAEAAAEGCDAPLSPCTLSDVSHEDAVEAMAHFDASLCAALARLRPHPPPGTAGFDDGFGAQPRVPCHRLEPVYLNLGPETSAEVRQMPGLTVRPTRTWSNTLPPTQAGAPYAYDLSALLAEFKLKKSRDKSPAAGAAPPPPSWPAAGAGQPRPAPRAPAPHGALPPKDDEPAAMVMIPGMRRKA